MSEVFDEIDFAAKAKEIDAINEQLRLLAADGLTSNDTIILWNGLMDQQHNIIQQRKATWIDLFHVGDDEKPEIKKTKKDAMMIFWQLLVQFCEKHVGTRVNLKLYDFAYIIACEWPELEPPTHMRFFLFDTSHSDQQLYRTELQFTDFDGFSRCHCRNLCISRSIAYDNMRINLRVISRILYGHSMAVMAQRHVLVKEFMKLRVESVRRRSRLHSLNEDLILIIGQLMLQV